MLACAYHERIIGHMENRFEQTRKQATRFVALSWTEYGGANNRPVRFLICPLAEKHLEKVASVESLLGSLTQEGKLADWLMRYNNKLDKQRT